MTAKKNIFSLNKFQFPDFEEYKSNLITLDRFNFQNFSEEEIYNKYFDLAKTIPLCHRKFNKSEFNKFTFFRARLNIEHAKEDVSLISTYSFPPTIFCKQNGRANLANKSVFYCSDNPQSAITECKPKNGDEGFLSIWKGNTVREIKSGICLPRNLTTENNWNGIAKDSFNNFRKWRINDLSKIEHIDTLHDFVNFKFKYEQSPYSLTSIIANEIIYGSVPHDFLVYSSAIDEKFCNMAFHPNSIFENLRLEKVLKFKISNIEKGIINLGKVGHVQNSRIIWKNRTREEEKYFTKEKNR